MAMIRGVHTMFYTSKAAELRDFLRDKLGFSATDVGGGWLIFDIPEADMGCHPADPSHPGGKSGTHSISFYCDDIAKSVAQMKKKGVKFDGPVVDQGYGLVTNFQVPGGFSLQLYQPKYEKKRTRKARK